VGIDRLAETARLLGMDAVFTDIDGSLPVIVPDKKWRAAEHRTPWTTAETAYCSIGMGFVQESPVHLASLAATVANGGDVWKPRLSMNTPAERTQNRILPADQMEVVRNGMRLVVNDAKGTGKNARSTRFTIAGKTGTAQKFRFENGKQVDDYRAWFIGFAPYENPRFAICVLVENGQSGGKTAAPIAKTILEQAMALKEAQPAPAPQRRAPVQGHFRLLERVPN
jgi:penicillin-binding protein 2